VRPETHGYLTRNRSVAILDKEALIAGANTMLEIAVKLLDKKNDKKKAGLTIEEEDDSQDE
jgi:ligand-binding sensor protein